MPVRDVPLAADSVLYLHPRLRSLWPEFICSVPQLHRQALQLADGVCQSGIETLMWLHLRGLPVEVRRQVPVGGVGNVDFVVGNVVIEVDGETYHTDPLQFENDRRRDAVLATRGFRVLRFSYRHVTERWPEVASAISAVLLRT
ncbi:MAG: DUF559 domain-containing protein [Pseudolysinimonas sp.]